MITRQINKFKSFKIELSPHLLATETAIFYASTLLGLTPMSLRHTKSSKVPFARWSAWTNAYSLVLLLVLVCLGLSGIYNEIHALDKSFRMQTMTDRIVMSVDVLALMVITALGILSGPYRLVQMASFYNHIAKVDKVLIAKNTKEERDKNIKVLRVVYGILSGTLAFDVLFWYNMASQVAQSHFYLKNYISFYVCYYIMTTLVLSYMNTAIVVQRRLRRLNEYLDVFKNRNMSVLDVEKHPEMMTDESLKIFNKNCPKNLANIIELLLKHKDVNEFVLAPNDLHIVTNNSAEYIGKLSEVYGCLCDAVLIVNNAYGFIIMIIVIGCLLHLIETPYFFLHELSGRGNLPFIAVQLIWIMLHFARLIMIIEPCHRTRGEAKNTSKSICQMLHYPNLDKKFRKQVELFSMQLMHRPIVYSAFGLCILDRPLLTTIAGAITTYLVILLQFSKN